MLHMSRKLGLMGNETVRARIADIKRIPHKLQTLLDGAGSIEELGRKYMGFKNFLYLGRGINFPIALEGALKLKEISYIHAEAYAAGEMKHGPIALIDENMPVVVVSPNDQTYKKTCSNVEEVVARRGNILRFTDTDAHDMAAKANIVFHVPAVPYDLQPIVHIVPLQLFAYHIANLLGTDVDQPRNLAKSVTVSRAGRLSRLTLSLQDAPLSTSGIARSSTYPKVRLRSATPRLRVMHRNSPRPRERTH
jgi:glucosamine--fructose-6-phosphate aminotransferase (isomerizing)